MTRPARLPKPDMPAVAGAQATGSPAEPARHDFADRVIAWQGVHGRHDLPWQKPRTDYRVWLSEVMLQQTQVATVIPYFEKFLATFPSLNDLADASSEQVMALWSGLGYYRRARLLHQCAQEVAQEHGGRFPTERDELIALPGIGRTTAAAIRVFAHGQRDAILDGNVKRVFCRHFGVEGVPDSGPVLRTLWTIAEHELPVAGAVAYTQGLMDLGAGVCTRSKPRCEVCPVTASCVALASGRIAELPTRKVRGALPWREKTMLIIGDTAARVLLVERPGHGIWGGLLSLPESSLPASSPVTRLLADSGLAALASDGKPGPAPACEELATIEHAFTHFRLRIRPVRLTIGTSPLTDIAADGAGAALRLMPLSDIETAPLPAPIKVLLRSL